MPCFFIITSEKEVAGFAQAHVIIKENIVKQLRGAFLIFKIVIFLLLFTCQAGFSQSTYKILLSNDDGIDAPGLEALAQKLSTLGSVTVAASRDNRSGASHGITSNAPIKIMQSDRNGVQWYTIDALPATCVRLAIESLLPAKPDIVVAGINNGDTAGVVSFYSATVACAREAAITGLAAIAVHLEKSETMDYEGAAAFIAALVREIKDKKLPPGVYLNINIPALPRELIRGVMITKQDLRSTRQYFEKRIGPAGEISYWPSYKHLEPDKEKTDIWALKNGYISITPFQINQTAYSELKSLESWEITKWKAIRH
jgi:5'-nucleotidase